MHQTAVDCDVVVVGAGPIGLNSALLLRQYGHNVQLIERHPTHYKQPRAVGLYHQAVRMFDGLGLHDELLKSNALQSIRGLVSDTTQMVDSDGVVLVEYPFNGPSSKSGTELSFALHQPTLEAVLEQACKDRGVLIRRGTEVADVLDRGDYVEVKTRKFPQVGGDSEPQSTTARFVIGCDGANSVVRTSVGIRFHSLQGPGSRWLVIDVVPKTPGAGREWKDAWQSRHHLDPARPRTAVPSPATRRRWEFMVLPTESSEEAATAEFVWPLLARYNCGPDTAILERMVVYQLKAGWAESFSKGRVCLAGDSSHLAPQFLGQGLNSGLRDAKSLCWRIDFAIKNPNKNWRQSFQDYSVEQLDTTKRFVSGASMLETLFTITDPTAARQRDAMMRANPQLPPDLEILGSPGMHLRNEKVDYLRGSGPGSFFMHDKVDFNGKTGFFDAVVGTGWVLLGIGPQSPADYLTSETRKQYHEHFTGISAYFGDGGCSDLSGRYSQWFEENGAVAALLRPDFYLYGFVQTTAEVEGLLKSALDHLA